jgi:hypothetical protein
MDDPHPELLSSALVSKVVFAPVTERGSSEISDANLDAVWEFLQTGPSSLAHLQPSDGKRDWLTEMKERIFGSLREGLAITRYHLDRVGLIEYRIEAIAKEHEAALLPTRNMGLAITSRPLVAEYQAFEFALRRSLEYLAGAVSAYFKTEGNRIRNLAVTVGGREPTSASAAVVARLENASIERLIGVRSGPKSVRDRVAHHESVSPGVINIGRKFDGSLWVRLHGEAEGLNTSFPEETETLSEILGKRISRVEDLALGLFEDLGLLPSPSK